MPKIIFCYPSMDKENEGTEMLYSPLALAYLARHTPDYYEKELYDEYVGDNLDPYAIEADIVAFSSLTSGILRAYELSDILRQRGILTVAGGAHVTAMEPEASEHFDVVISGEGENPWKEFIKDYETGEVKDSYFGKMNVPLDELGTPDRSFIHPNYHYPSLMTSRGCPFHCSFCYLTVYKNRKFRTIPHETVLQDFEQVKDQNIVIVTDENFIGYSERDYEDRKQLLKKMIDRNFRFYWGCQASANIAEQTDLMSLMYKSGCRAVFIGFETNDEEGLKQVNKKQNYNVDFKDIVAKIHKNKIAVIASTILGLDNQKNGYHKLLISELERIKADYVRVFYMTAWPGTPLYKQLEKQDRICTEWNKLRKDIPTVKFKNYSHQEIILARKEIMDHFFGPKHIIKTLFRWILRDRSLMFVFIKMWWRNKVSEKIRNKRAMENS